MSRWLKIGFKFIAVVLAGILLGVILLAAVYAIPQEALFENVKKSAEILREEGEYPFALSGIRSAMLDNFTDSIMLNVTYCKGDSFAKDMLSAEYYAGDYDSKTEALYRYVLFHDFYGTDGRVNYSRYWHGYQVILAPLLLLLDISDIRHLNMAIQTALVFAVMMLLYKKGRKDMLIPFFVMWLCLVPPALFSSMQFSTTFYVMILLALAVSLGYGKWSFLKLMLAFEVAGMAEAYVDFLTYPFVSLGVPAVLWFSLDIESRKSMETRIKEFISLCFSWAIGYGGMWSGKWVVAALFTDENAIGEAVQAILRRSSASNGETTYSFLWTLLKGAYMFAQGIFIIAFLAAFLIWLICYLKKKKQACCANASGMGAIALCCLLPFVWYAATLNHSNIHMWFAYREYSISIYGALSILYLTLLRTPGQTPEKIEQ